MAEKMAIPMDLAMALAPVLVNGQATAIGLAKLPAARQDWGSLEVRVALAHLRECSDLFAEKLCQAEHQAGKSELAAVAARRGLGEI